MTYKLRVMIVFFGFAAIACAESLGDWQGSLDAKLRYRPQDSTTAIVDVPNNSFAKEAGLLPGDLVLAVDGVNVTGMPFEEVLAAVRGPVGTPAKLTVQRGDQVLEKVVERRPIKKLKDKKKAI